MKCAFLRGRTCSLAAGVAVLALLAVMLMAPITVIFITNAMLVWWRTRHAYYPHDSGSAVGVVLTMSTAVVGAYMLVYDLVGLQTSFIEYPILMLLILLGLALYFYRQKGHGQQVTEVFVWAYLSFDRRIASVWSAFILGTQEAAVSFPQKVVTSLVWLALTGIVLYVLPIYFIVPMLGHVPEGETGRHLIKALMWLLCIFGVLMMVLAVRNYATAHRSGFGFTIPRIVDLPLLCKFAKANAEAKAKALRIAHLSDLHIPLSDRLTEEADWPTDILDRCIEGIKAADKAAPLGAIVFSGDITDTGHSDAWKVFTEKFEQYAVKTVFAPGNHDLNIVGYGIPSIFLVADEAHMGGRWKRMASYVDAASHIMGERAHVWDNDRLKSLPEAWKTLRNNEKDSSMRQYKAAAGLFPFVVTVADVGKHVKFMVWNTVRTSALAMNNSYGIIENEQLANFEKIVAHFKEEQESVSYIHVMHHKLAFPVAKLHRRDSDTSTCCVYNYIIAFFRALKHRLQISGMVMLNARSAIESVAKGGSSVVLHGHHHASFWGQIKHRQTVLHVVSAPSTTLGTEVSIAGACDKLGFDVLELATSVGVCALAAPPSRIGI